MKILVTGDRNWTDKEFIYRVLEDHMSQGGKTYLIEGGARGADSIASEWALAEHVNYKGEPLQIFDFKYPADWKGLGKAAGVIRNKQMVDENPDIDVVLAFHPDISKSKGTKHMISYAVAKSNATIILYTGRENLDADAFEAKFIIMGEYLQDLRDL